MEKEKKQEVACPNTIVSVTKRTKENEQKKLKHQGVFSSPGLLADI